MASYKSRKPAKESCISQLMRTQQAASSGSLLEDCEVYQCPLAELFFNQEEWPGAKMGFEELYPELFKPFLFVFVSLSPLVQDVG